MLQPPRVAPFSLSSHSCDSKINSPSDSTSSYVVFTAIRRIVVQSTQNSVRIFYTRGFKSILPQKISTEVHFWFWTRYMPASGSVKSFAGIISFLSNIDGSPDWTWTSDTLINSQVLLPTELRRNIETQQVISLLCLLSVGTYLSSRAVARQVLSTQVSLTTVFGMGTGGPSPPSAPTERSLSKLNNEDKDKT